jgi:hypothetical protein
VESLGKSPLGSAAIGNNSLEIKNNPKIYAFYASGFNIILAFCVMPLPACH